MHSYSNFNVVFHEVGLSLIQSNFRVFATGGSVVGQLVVDGNGSTDLQGSNPHSLHTSRGKLLHPSKPIFTNDSLFPGGGALEVSVGLVIIGRVEVIKVVNGV